MRDVQVNTDPVDHSNASITALSSPMGLFHTAMKNELPAAVTADGNLRTIDWVPDGDIKLCPCNYDEGYFGKLPGAVS